MTITQYMKNYIPVNSILLLSVKFTSKSGKNSLNLTVLFVGVLIISTNFFRPLKKLILKKN